MREPLTAFITAALKYIGGADGRYEAFTTESYYPQQGKLPQPAAIWEDFAAFLQRLFQLPAAAQKAKLSLADIGTEQAALILGYGTFSLLRSILDKDSLGTDAAALVAHWQLDRKLCDAYARLGISGDLAYRATVLMKAVLSRTGPKTASLAMDASTLVAENYEMEDFRFLLGVNVFNDVTWFNKEAFDITLTYAPLFLALETEDAFKAVKPAKKSSKAGSGPTAPATDTALAAAWQKRLKAIAGVSAQFGAARDESGYRLDKLIEGLEKPPVGMAGKKTKK
jgi:hypothetical protein